MGDDDIVSSLWARSEQGLVAARTTYGRYCHVIAYGILRNHEDAEEVVSDTLTRAWGAIPPARPANLKTYLGKIARNLALNALERASAAKRGGGQVPMLLTELGEIAVPGGPAEPTDLTRIIDTFLGRLDPPTRRVFVRRYWYAGSLDEIAAEYGMSIAAVKSVLYRLRQGLKRDLEQEGITP